MICASCLAAIRGIGDEAAGDGGGHWIGAADGAPKEEGRSGPGPLESESLLRVVMKHIVACRVLGWYCMLYAVTCILCGAPGRVDCSLSINARFFLCSCVSYSIFIMRARSCACRCAVLSRARGFLSRLYHDTCTILYDKI